MQIKNKLTFTAIIFLYISIFNSNLQGEEFNILADKISIDKENNIVVGEGEVEATDSMGKIIKANKITYEKNREFILAEGLVEVADLEGNIIGKHDGIINFTIGQRKGIKIAHKDYIVFLL